MKKTILLNLALVLVIASLSPAATRLVPDEYATIQAAIDDCVDGDIVIVAPGTYTGDGNRDIDFGGKAITVRSTDPNDPNIIAATIIDCNDEGRGFYFHNNEDANSILDGFTITRGYTGGHGGGIYCLDSSPTIINCTITANLAEGEWAGGGGVYCLDSSPTIINCTISGNSAEYGGGIYCRRTSSLITNNTIAGNSADMGGGIYCEDSDPVITNNIISDNTANGTGGGIHCKYACPAIANCTIANNSAKHDGGGIYFFGGRVTITACKISGNSADSGGGIYWRAGCGDNTLILTNCIIVQNTADKNAGICLDHIDIATITNCTIVGNLASEKTGAIYFYGGDLTTTNCILWDNLPQQIVEERGTVSVVYSDVQGGWEGEGNIDVDPLFVQPGYWDANGTPNEPGDDFWVGGDYHLWKGSECIDTGTNNPSSGLPKTDLDRKPRPFDGDDDGMAISDMGAYEYPIACDEPIIKVKPWKFEFFAVCDRPDPEPQVMRIWNPGAGTLHWEVVEDCNWLEATPTNGVSTGDIDEVTLTVDPNGLSPGDYSCILRVLDPNAVNSPVAVRIVLHLGALLCVPQHFPTIQAAINAAEDYDMVLVADDTYTGEGNRGLDFGGKAITVRSENGPNNCIIDCQNLGRAFYFHNGEDASSVLDGLTITNGYATNGGGIYCGNSSPTITNCIITGNLAKAENHAYGGGIYCRDSNPIVTNCTITGNSSDGKRSYGGGIYCGDSDPIITNCTVTGNSSDGKRSYGGGIYCGDSDPIITNCTVTGNSSDGSGGGIYCRSDRRDGTFTITNCTIVGNAGTGIDYDGRNSDLIVTNCTIAKNEHTGIDCVSDEGNLIITNCTIAENGYGGIVGRDARNATITNCTIVGNASGGIDYVSDEGNLIITNSIVYNNICSGRPQMHIDAITSAVTYSNVQGSWPGIGNIDTDPCFVNPGWLDDNNTPDEPRDDRWVGGDYHLLEDSPCINAGDQNYVPIPNETDLDGRPRIIAGRIDMGAYEFNHVPVADAGPDQIAYAWLDGIAEVTLDGSGSFDEDGLPLTYKWSWMVDGEIVTSTSTSGDGIVNMLDFAALAKQWLQAGNSFADIAPPGGDGVIDLLDLSILTDGWLSTPALSNWDPRCDIAPAGATVTIELPIGEHVIELIVNDGIVDSEPDEVIITVVEPMESHLRIFPRIIHRHSRLKEILSLVRLPEGITKDQIDSDELLVLYPGGIEASHQWVLGRGGRVKVFALFGKAELMDAVPDNGSVELQVVSQLRTGRYFYGTDTVWIIGRQ